MSQNDEKDINFMLRNQPNFASKIFVAALYLGSTMKAQAFSHTY